MSAAQPHQLTRMRLPATATVVLTGVSTVLTIVVCMNTDDPLKSFVELIGRLFPPAATLPIDRSGDVQLAILFIIYGSILFVGCKQISDGSQLLMLTPWASLVGNTVLPVISAVPDGAFVLFSGFGPDAQKYLAVGIGACETGCAAALCVVLRMINMD